MTPDPLIDSLARFTPKPADRDLLLFKAGRASVRPQYSVRWYWPTAVAVLLVAQLLTLLAWQTERPVVIMLDSPVLPSIPEEGPASIDPFSYIALCRNPDALPALNESSPANIDFGQVPLTVRNGMFD